MDFFLIAVFGVPVIQSNGVFFSSTCAVESITDQKIYVNPGRARPNGKMEVRPFLEITEIATQAEQNSAIRRLRKLRVLPPLAGVKYVRILKSQWPAPNPECLDMPWHRSSNTPNYRNYTIK